MGIKRKQVEEIMRNIIEEVYGCSVEEHLTEIRRRRDKAIEELLAAHKRGDLIISM